MNQFLQIFVRFVVQVYVRFVWIYVCFVRIFTNYLVDEILNFV
jgi:hypothetical protein